MWEKQTKKEQKFKRSSLVKSKQAPKFWNFRGEEADMNKNLRLLKIKNNWFMALVIH